MVTNQLQSKSVSAILLCMLKRLAALILILDIAATFVKPCRNLCNLPAIVIFLVEERSQRGCKLCGTGA